MRPTIGIILNFSCHEREYRCDPDYATAVERAGGVPLFLPFLTSEALDELLDRCDGLLFSGGGDFAGRFYGASDDKRLRRVVPERDRFEWALGRRALDVQLPLLGICRGMQWLNVMEGGSLYADISYGFPSALNHGGDSNPGELYRHSVALELGSSLFDITGTATLEVNSRHHQAISTTGRRVTVAARAPDGIIEGIELQGHPFAIGVQWHPENLAASDPASRRLFEAFTSAAAEYRSQRRKDL
jgi:putative glutamine amidotransferase